MLFQINLIALELKTCYYFSMKISRKKCSVLKSKRKIISYRIMLNNLC